MDPLIYLSYYPEKGDQKRALSLKLLNKTAKKAKILAKWTFRPGIGSYR